MREGRKTKVERRGSDERGWNIVCTERCSQERGGKKVQSTCT